MSTENSISQDLYDLLITHNFDPEITNDRGLATQPSDGTVFTFDWISSKGTNYGTAVIVLTDSAELILFFGDNLGKTMDDAEDKNEWFDFMQSLSQFATRHNFNTFTPKNINKLKHTMAGLAAIKEGLFEGYYGNRKVSYMGDETQARLVIKHSRPLGENDKRYHNIERLFIETQLGERFLLPFNNLMGGRAMLEHVKQGGRPYDIRGNHIVEMVNELKVLNRFRRANQGRVMEGITQTVIEQANQYHANLHDDLRSIGHSRGYNRYFETWTPTDVSDTEALVENLKNLFVQQTIDHRIEAALPVLAKIHSQENSMKEAEIFENWASRIIEGTWAMPDTPEQKAQLQALMAKEINVGPDAMNATQQLYDLIGDDQLFDQLSDLAKQDPDADARPVIAARLKELGFDLPPGSEPSTPTMQEGDNLATFVEARCNHTMEGESCPVHGLAECGMHESLRQGEYHVATVTLDDGTTQKVRITSDEGFRDQIQRHFARQGRQVLDIDVDYAVRADEDSTDPMDRRGGVLDSFYEAEDSNTMAQAVARRMTFAEQGVAEMDSQGYRGHRGDEDPGKGPEKLVKPAKAKDVAKDAEKILTKALDKPYTKQGVEEVSGDNKPRFTGVPARDSNPPEIKSTRVLPPAPGRPTFVGKPDHLQSPDPLERLKSLALAKTR